MYSDDAKLPSEGKVCKSLSYTHAYVQKSAFQENELKLVNSKCAHSMDIGYVY